MLRARLPTFAVAFVVAAACAASPGPSTEADWQDLFDGQTLNGWTPKIRGEAMNVDPRRTFRVEDGAITVSYKDYEEFDERFGHLFYDMPFSAYRLKLQYRFVGEPLADTPGWAVANSGVMVFSQSPQSMAVEDSFPVSVEAQLLGYVEGEGRMNGNMCSPGTDVVIAGVLTKTHCINSQSLASANGEWIDFELEVLPSGQVTHFVNGEAVMTYTDVQLDPEGALANSIPLIEAAGGRTELDGGYIALQSEGHPIQFRSIRLLNLLP